MPSPTTFLEAALHGRYRIERELGAGGMALVWLATDLRHERSVALKLLRPELARSGVAERFLREARLLADLQHPHILPLLESGVIPLTEGGEGECPYYVMPLVRGESLRERAAREGQLPLDAVLAITSQVAGALDYAHRRGVVHRDVKPENLLVADDQVYLADFGIASALEDAAGGRLTETGLTLGTPAYMSPEQAAAERRIDGRSDQYSLACVIFELLAGEPPFTGPTAHAIMAKRLAGPAPSVATLRQSLPPHVSSAIARALAQAPADRFPSTGSFAAALAAPVSVPATPPVLVRARSRWGWFAGAALALAFGVRSHFLPPTPPAPVVVAPHNSVAIGLRERADRAREQRTQAGVAEAVRLYAAAITRDSGYAPAWNGLARAYLEAWAWDFTVEGTPRDSLLARALRASDGAFVADSGIASTWVARAAVMRQVSPSTRADVLRALRRAFALDSLSPDAWDAYALAMAETDSLDRAILAWRRAVDLAPLSVLPTAFLGFAHFWSQQYDSAATWADSAISLDPTNVVGRQVAGLAALARHDGARALREFSVAARVGAGAEHVFALGGLAMARAMSGDPATARQVAAEAERAANQSRTVPLHAAVALAEAWSALGDRDRAFAWLGRFDQPLDLHFQLHLRRDPAMDPIRSDPRFAAILTPLSP